MSVISPRISPCLWFDNQAEPAAQFYTSIFPNSRIVTMSRYGNEGTEIHGGVPGSVMTVAFELDGHLFTALNGGPVFTFTEAISLQVYCDGQEEIDHYWNSLKQDGDEAAQQCGWLKDRYGVSWQVVPRQIVQMMTDPERARSDRVMAAMLKMKTIDLAGLQAAYER